MMECKCTFSQKMVGDGCSVCNPEFYIPLLKEEIQQLENELGFAREHIRGLIKACDDHGVSEAYTLAPSKYLKDNE